MGGSCSGNPAVPSVWPWLAAGSKFRLLQVTWVGTRTRSRHKEETCLCSLNRSLLSWVVCYTVYLYPHWAYIILMMLDWLAIDTVSNKILLIAIFSNSCCTHLSMPVFLLPGLPVCLLQSYANMLFQYRESFLFSSQVLMILLFEVWLGIWVSERKTVLGSLI